MSVVGRTLRWTAVCALFIAMTILNPTTAAAEPATGSITGGQTVYFDQVRCLTSFSIEHPSLGDGFVTAGGCGAVGQQVSLSPGGEPIGEVRSRTLAWLHVDLYAGWIAEPYAQPDHPVVGVTPSPVGASVCRAGPTTGWHCGTITALGQTISFPEGTITDVAQTNVCIEPGETGAPYLSDGHAQGIGLGGSGNCASGGQSYFYPVLPIINAGLQIKTV